MIFWYLSSTSVIPNLMYKLDLAFPLAIVVYRIDLKEIDKPMLSVKTLRVVPEIWLKRCWRILRNILPNMQVVKKQGISLHTLHAISSSKVHLLYQNSHNCRSD